MFVYLVPLTVTFLTLESGALRLFRRALWVRGIGVRNLIIVGATDAAARVMQSIVASPGLGYRLLGYVDDEARFSEWIIPARYRNGELVPHLGSNSALVDLIDEHNVHEIIMALPATMHETINEIVGMAREREVDYTFVPDVFELRVDALTLQEINGVPLIGLKDNSLTGWNYVVKRLVDIVLSLLVIAIFALPMLVIAIAVKLNSPGPIVVKQTRIGKEGKPFTFYKFRSMYQDADARFADLLRYNETNGATFKMKEDPRVTKVGRFIRRASLDELPQFFNILFGHMSFVGPRPGLPREVVKYEPWHFRRLEVTPGLSGLWQVSGRSNLSFDDMVKLDIYYAEHWSLWLDLKIIVRTLPAVIKGDGAY
jgi:exopolysaccharide biosynthesis polyprenyl glycosylphosphotransferase